MRPLYKVLWVLIVMPILWVAFSRVFTGVPLALLTLTGDLGGPLHAVLHWSGLALGMVAAVGVTRWAWQSWADTGAAPAET